MNYGIMKKAKNLCFSKTNFISPSLSNSHSELIYITPGWDIEGKCPPVQSLTPVSVIGVGLAPATQLTASGRAYIPQVRKFGLWAFSIEVYLCPKLTLRSVNSSA